MSTKEKEKEKENENESYLDMGPWSCCLNLVNGRIFQPLNELKERDKQTPQLIVARYYYYYIANKFRSHSTLFFIIYWLQTWTLAFFSVENSESVRGRVT